MDERRIPKNLLCNLLFLGKRAIVRPQLRYKDVCKCDMKALQIDESSWEMVAPDRSAWRSTLHKQLIHGEDRLKASAAEKRENRKERLHRKEMQQNLPSSDFICMNCGRDCRALIGLLSHRKKCLNQT